MAARRKKTDDQPCSEHYPDGFPEGVDGVGCEHGSWSRGGGEDATGTEPTAKAADGSGQGDGESK